ncbi:MAG: Chaperone protein DnaJ [Arcobacter lacus]|nr:MAG: Chaperone protein DnaJ [Arcobacter lacus]
MDYEEFEKAVDMFGILTRLSKKDIKQKYLRLSKKYHPDTPTGSVEKFQELKKNYEILQKYMDDYNYSFEVDEYKKQFPAFTNYKNWFK